MRIQVLKTFHTMLYILAMVNLARAQMPRVLLHKLGIHPVCPLSKLNTQSRPDFSKFTSLPPASRPTPPPLRTRPNTSLVASASRPTSESDGRTDTKRRGRNGVSGHRRQSGGRTCRDVSRRIWVDDFAVNVTELNKF